VTRVRARRRGKRGGGGTLDGEEGVRGCGDDDGWRGGSALAPARHLGGEATGMRRRRGFALSCELADSVCEVSIIPCIVRPVPQGINVRSTHVFRHGPLHSQPMTPPTGGGGVRHMGTAAPAYGRHGRLCPTPGRPWHRPETGRPRYGGRDRQRRRVGAAVGVRTRYSASLLWEGPSQVPSLNVARPLCRRRNGLMVWAVCCAGGRI
jgi:hypothetical protein